MENVAPEKGIAVRMAEHFLARQRTLERYIELCPIPCYITDADGHVNFVNEAFRQLLCAGFDELIGTGFWDFVHPDDKQQLKDSILHMQSGDAQKVFQRLRFVRPDTQLVTTLIMVAPVRGNGLVGYILPHCDLDTCPAKNLIQSLA